MREKLFELTLIIGGLVGLLVLFTLFFAGPRLVIQQLLKLF